MRIAVTLLIILTCVGTGLSQKSKQIQVCGRITDSLNSERIEYATIQFISNDSGMLEYGTISDSLGKFCIDKIVCQSYTVIVSYIGYETQKFTIEIPAKGYYYFFKVALAISHHMLETIEIIDQQKGVKVMVDKTVFIPDSISISNSITGLDLIEKAPGVSVRRSDQTIKLLGNSNVLVLVDGVDNNRNLNAIEPKDIERIEIIKNPSSKYDSDVINVINVVLKEDRKKGLKISTTLSYFSENKYNHSNVHLEYEFPKFRVFGMYKIKLHNIHYFDTTYRHSDINDLRYTIIQYPTNDNMSKSMGNIFKYGVDYYINKKNLLNITGNYEIYNYNSSSDNITNYFIGNLHNYTTLAYSERKGRNKLQNYTVYYARKFTKTDQKLSFNSNYYLMQRGFDSEQNTEFIYSADSTTENSLRNENSTNEIQAVNSKLDYYYPITKRIFTETGVQLYHRNIKNNYTTINESSFFKYQDFRTAFFGVFTYNADKLSFQVGIRIENFNINIYDSIKYTQWNYLPSISSLININQAQKLKITYNEKLNYPRYHMLTPFTYYANDSLTISSGNPYLKPEKFSNFEINYSYKKKYSFLSASIYYRRYNNLIGINTHLTDNNELIEKYDNITHSKKFGGYLYFQSIVLGFMQASFYTDVFYQKFIDDQFSGFSYNMWFTTEVGLPADMYLSVDMSIMGKDLSYNGYAYQSPLIDEITIGKSIFRGKGEVSFSLLNYFISDYSKDVRWNDNYREEFKYFPDNSCYLVRLNYFFTKGKKIKQRDRESYMERDEK